MTIWDQRLDAKTDRSKYSIREEVYAMTMQAGNRLLRPTLAALLSDVADLIERRVCERVKEEALRPLLEALLKDETLRPSLEALLEQEARRPSLEAPGSSVRQQFSRRKRP